MQDHLKKVKLQLCGASRGGCPCGLIWLNGETATKLFTAKDFSAATEGAEEDGLTEQGAIEVTAEIIRRWEAQRTFWNRLKNLF